MEIPENAIPEEFFPPCIKCIFQGLKDGKKRSMFILTNFMSSCGWDFDDIEKRLKEWNKKNAEPIRDVIINGQVRYRKQSKKRVMPPNCANKMYYHDFGICKPDNLCGRIKNPVQYSKRKVYYLNKESNKEKNEDDKQDKKN